MDDKVLLSDLIGHDLSRYVLLNSYYLIAELFNGRVKLDSVCLMVKANSSKLYCLNIEVMEFLARVLRVKANPGYSYDIKIGKRLVLVNRDTGLGYFLNRTAFRVKVYTHQEILAAIEEDEDAFCWNHIERFVEAD